MELYENERCDEVNDRLRLIQKPDGLTFGTDALLLAAYINARKKRGAELGGGSGIISMLLLAREKLSYCRVIEVQEEYADLIRRNAQLNLLTEMMDIRHMDIRELAASEDLDIVFTNPPYMKTTSGRMNELDAKAIARHEIHGDITDFTAAAARLLKFGGAFYAVYRPDRLADITVAMRASGIEPKRMTFVHANTASEASMVLIEGKRGARSGMMLTRPLIIYKDEKNNAYTEDMEWITENGSFPASYRR